MNQTQRPVASAPRRPRIKKSNEEKAASEQEHLSLVLVAAETAIGIFRQHNLPAAIFGSLACKLYGNSRCPKDADILVFPPNSQIDAETLKRLIVAAAPRYFYLKDARDPAATYRILWFRQPSRRRETKVDILVPGPMSLPAIPLPRIRWVSDLPLAPFPFILLHKLKGWADHRAAPEGFKRARQSTDAADVRRLLDIVPEMRVLQELPSWPEDPELFDAELQTDSVARVKEYCAEFPGRAERWRSLGFDVPELGVAA
ncbi:hypothetical protein B0H17DRAFT_990858 [Mycena rosella]|uniref:Uncharacterized protein n=1 Tax=Mycena rosella TaxID=1033263 RepID=A0AAD7CVD6_MYCRO|nr:hypothetical protein B0H17DRAFT_990858 [Mycena rosella]